MRRGSRLSKVTNRYRHNNEVKKMRQEEKRQKSRIRRDMARRAQAPISARKRKEAKVSDKYTYVRSTRKERDDFDKFVDAILSIPEKIFDAIWDLIFAILPPYNQ